MKIEENRVKRMVDECIPVLLDVEVDYTAGEPPPDELWPDRLPVEILHYTAISDSGVHYVPLRQVP